MELPEPQPFPLIPRRRLVGLPFGALNSLRRGPGSDVAGSRPYRPGDDVGSIDWHASARISAATGRDQFVVRERYAEEAPRVVALCDRRPSMGLYPDGLPWISKPQAVAVALRSIVVSALAARGLIGYLDYGGAAGGEPFWLQPRSATELWQIEARHAGPAVFDATEDNLTLALDHLARNKRDLPPGSFVFVLSDFLAPPPAEAWIAALARQWDIVPVIVQDPVWEASFPAAHSLVLPVADPQTGKVRPVRLTRRETRARALEHQERRRALQAELAGLGLEPVAIETDQPAAILHAFLLWSELRAEVRSRRR